VGKEIHMSKLDAFDQSKLDAMCQSKLDARTNAAAPATTIYCSEGYIGCQNTFFRPTTLSLLNETTTVACANRSWRDGPRYYALTRGFMKALTLPSGTYDTVSLTVRPINRTNVGSHTFDIEIHKISPYSTPLAFANWNYTSLGVLLTIPYATIMAWAIGSTSYTYALNASLLTPGEDLYMAMLHSEDISNTPARVDDWDDISLDNTLIKINT